LTAFFVTATGTDIGKTYVTAGLIRAIRATGGQARALKPVISGFDMEAAESSDSGLLLRAMGQAIAPESVARVSPWRFYAPLSPDMAAARENRKIDFSELVAFCRDEIRSTEGTLFIEGVGGVMVPLHPNHTVLDWIAALGIPAILVAGTYLGTISHTLTALAVLASRHISVRALVLNESEIAPVPVSETISTISRFVPVAPIAALPRANDLSASTEAFRRLCALLDWNIAG
jgi:dethiobiotin synthetase